MLVLCSEIRIGKKKKRENQLFCELTVVTWDHPVVCTCSPEGRSYPGLCWRECGQQIREGDSAALLRPHLECCVWQWDSSTEKHAPAGLGPEKSHRDGQGAGVTLPWRQAGGVWAVWPGEGRALGRTYSCISLSEEDQQEGQGRTV